MRCSWQFGGPPNGLVFVIVIVFVFAFVIVIVFWLVRWLPCKLKRGDIHSHWGAIWMVLFLLLSLYLSWSLSLSLSLSLSFVWSGARWRGGDVLGNWGSRGHAPVMTTLDGAWIHKWDNLDKLGIAQMSTIPAFLCRKRQIYLGYQTTWMGKTHCAERQ